MEINNQLHAKSIKKSWVDNLMLNQNRKSKSIHKAQLKHNKKIVNNKLNKIKEKSHKKYKKNSIDSWEKLVH